MLEAATLCVVEAATPRTPKAAALYAIHIGLQPPTLEQGGLHLGARRLALRPVTVRPAPRRACHAMLYAKAAVVPVADTVS